MIDTLIAFGCSNTFGAESIEDFDHNNPDNINHSYAKYLSDLLECKNYYNLAENGISNSEITKRIFKELPDMIKKHDSEKILVIVGWTDYNRIRLYLKHIIPFKEAFRQIIDICEYPLLCKFFPNQFKRTDNEACDIGVIIKQYPFMEQFLLGMMNYLFRTPSFYIMNTYAKLAAENYLIKNNLKFLTFPTLRSHTINDTTLNYIDPERDKTFINSEKILSHKNNIFEYDNEGNYKFSALDNFKQHGISKSGGHLKSSAHEALAKYLYSEIKDRDIL
jgi:hypothetical protein